MLYRAQKTSNLSSPLPEENTTMRIMQCIGIIAVVWGHIEKANPPIPNTLDYIFPYYSWHMPFLCLYLDIF